MRELDSPSLRLNHVFVIIFIVLIVIILSYRIFGDITLAILSSVGSIILSIFLVYIYSTQTRLMNNQTEIMNSQQEFQKNLERPIIHVHGYTDSRDNPVISDTNYFMKVLLTNSGKTSATNISIEFISVPSKEDRHNEWKMKSSRSPAIRVDFEESGWYTEVNDHLGAGEEKVEYQTPSIHLFVKKNRKENTWNFSSFSDILDETWLEKERMRLIGEIHYDGPNGHYEQEFFDKIVDITEERLAISLHQGSRVQEEQKKEFPREDIDT